jgi:superfamily I DNA/RNA helicase
VGGRPAGRRSGGYLGEYQLADAVRAEARELLDAVDGTVGVICAMERAPDVRKWLSTLSDERLKAAGSLESKGLEYDAVALVLPHELVAESTTGRRLLYVALTRSTQRLTVLTTRPWLP